MATYRKRDDRWQARIQRTGHPPLTKSFLTRQDAEKWARLTESELERGLYISPAEAQRTTLTDALTRYEREVSSSKKSYCVEKYYLQHWRNSKLAPLALSSIRGSDVADYRDERLKQKMSPTSVRHELAVLSHLFSVASREWGMESLGNPVKCIRLPAMARGRERRVTDEEVDAICQLVSAEVAACIRLALHTAMRRGELLKLCWTDIDLAKSVAVLDDTKNGERRVVPLSIEAKRQIRLLPHQLNGKLFNISGSSLSHSFKSAVDAARRAYTVAGGECQHHLTNLHFHDLRHEAVTRLFEASFNVMEVAAISGHKTLSMLQRYTHLKAEDLARKLG